MGMISTIHLTVKGYVSQKVTMHIIILCFTTVAHSQILFICSSDIKDCPLEE